MSSYKRKLPAARSKESGFVKFTNKQLAVYYWLISKAYYNSEKREDHYYIYNSDINYSKMARELGIGSVNTIKAALDKLEMYNYICRLKDTICIPHKEYYTYLDISLIRFLLAWTPILGAEILMFYSVLKRFFELNNANSHKTRFNTKLMLQLLGYDTTHAELYKKFRLYIAFLESYKLINTTTQVKTNRGCEYLEYTLWSITDKVSKECNYDDHEQAPEVDKRIVEQLTNSIDFTIE